MCLLVVHVLVIYLMKVLSITYIFIYLILMFYEGFIKPVDLFISVSFYLYTNHYYS